MRRARSHGRDEQIDSGMLDNVGHVGLANGNVRGDDGRFRGNHQRSNGKRTTGVAEFHAGFPSEQRRTEYQQRDSQRAVARSSGTTVASAQLEQRQSTTAA